MDKMEDGPVTLKDAIQRLAEAWHRDGVPDGAEYELDALISCPCPDGPDITRVVMDIQWSPEGRPYYHANERADLLREWIESALCDRDDGPAVVTFEAS